LILHNISRYLFKWTLFSATITWRWSATKWCITNQHQTLMRSLRN